MKQKIENRVDFIKYNVEPKEMRDMVVISGQPFYRSTGNNSGLLGVWLPFICLKGNKVPDIKHLCSLIHQDQLSNQILIGLTDASYSDKYILKLETIFNPRNRERYSLVRTWVESYCSKHSDNPQINKFKSKIDKLLDRCISLDCLAISCSLGGGVWEDNEFKSFIKKEFLDNKVPDPVKLKDTPVFETDDPEKVNQWLCESKANYACKIFHFSSASINAPTCGIGGLVDAGLGVSTAVFSLFAAVANKNTQTTIDKSSEFKSTPKPH